MIDNTIRIVDKFDWTLFHESMDRFHVCMALVHQHLAKVTLILAQYAL
jgi:primosomal protein N''